MHQNGVLARQYPVALTTGTLASRWTLTLVVVSAVVLGIGLSGLNLGYGSHGDSRAIFEASVAAISNGHYAPSRSYGVPLYEYAAALLQALGGTWLVNLYSLVLSLASIAIFARLLARPDGTATPAANSWGRGGGARHPLLLINASSPTEWAQAMFFLVGALSGIVAWLRTRRLAPLANYCLCICGLVLSRPDFAVVCLALGLAILWELKLERRASLVFIAVTALAGAVTVAIYMLLNGGPAFFLRAGEMVGDQIGLRRAFVAAAGVVDLFGLAGCVALALGVGLAIGRNGRVGLPFFEKLALLAWPILFARVAMLPDKLEYLFPLIPITPLALASKQRPVAMIALVAVSLMLNSIFTISLFDRAGASDRLAFSLHLNKSAVLQDRDARIAQTHALDSGFQTRVAAAAYGSDAAVHRLYFKNFNPGYTDDLGNLILSRDELYKLDNPRFTDARYARTSYNRIVICDRTFIADNVGWRVLQPPPAYASFDGNNALHCRAE